VLSAERRAERRLRTPFAFGLKERKVSVTHRTTITVFASQTGLGLDWDTVFLLLSLFVELWLLVVLELA
jgi:hypothetical protein